MSGVQTLGLLAVLAALVVLLGGAAWCIALARFERWVDRASHELVAAAAQAVARKYAQRVGVDDEHRRFLVKALARQLEVERSKLLRRPV